MTTQFVNYIPIEGIPKGSKFPIPVTNNMSTSIEIIVT